MLNGKESLVALWSNILLEVNNLKKYFSVGKGKVVKAVDDVTFHIYAGETLGLVGESGCGKTTVGRTIMRLYEPDGGEVIFDDQNIHTAGRKAYHEITQRMQMIFQDPYASLNPRFTIADIIAEGLDIHRLCDSDSERRDRVYELLEMVGLNIEHAGRFPHELSGGQRQRVGIARALAVNPEFIVCDEPISALDVSIQAQIVNLLTQLQRDLKLTYLFIAHDLSMVRYVSDYTAVMYGGTLVEYGETEEVYTHSCHPYTRGLLTAVPTADPKYERMRERVIIRGEVPSLINPPRGCRFADRCDYALDICSQEDPKFVNVGSGHAVACHRVDSGS
ncbi:MAG TPA: ATP-binding cassette domain-containing protein [Bacillota bacterium]|nr:ATP-binding cassette domain-containing protein [Bacillota bacterium]